MSYVRTPPHVYEYQTEAAIDIAPPTSAALYTVLDTTPNVRIIAIMGKCQFTAGAPDPLEIIVTIDGKTIIYKKATPATGTSYGANLLTDWDDANQQLGNLDQASYRAFLLEGRSVKIQARVTGGTLTHLIALVKWARRT
jgi:hypothetical protein